MKTITICIFIILTNAFGNENISKSNSIKELFPKCFTVTSITDQGVILKSTTKVGWSSDNYFFDNNNEFLILKNKETNLVRHHSSFSFYPSNALSKCIYRVIYKSRFGNDVFKDEAILIIDKDLSLSKEIRYSIVYDGKVNLKDEAQIIKLSAIATPTKQIIPSKSEAQKLEKVESTPEVSIPKEPVSEQPSQIKKNLALPISIGGFLVLLGGWFFWKKGR